MDNDMVNNEGYLATLRTLTNCVAVGDRALHMLAGKEINSMGIDSTTIMARQLEIQLRKKITQAKGNLHAT